MVLEAIVPSERKQIDKNGNKLNCCVTCQTNYAKRGFSQCKTCESKGLDPVRDRAKWVAVAEASKNQRTLSFD